MTPTDQASQGADVLADAVFSAVQKYVSEEVARMLSAALAPVLQQIKAIPAGPAGEPGAAGKDGSDGAAGQTGERGEAGAPGERGERGAPGDSGPQGEAGTDGAKGDAGESGMDGMPGAPGEPGRDGRDGSNGRPGRDAAEIEVLHSIDERKSYQRGTFATHKGGLWRAADTTDGMDGWVCVTRGVDREEEAVEDGGRLIKRRTMYSDGQVFEREIKTAAMVYRGLFKEEGSYEPGDATTWGGSVWHCEEPTSEKPGTGCKAWRLAVKRGNDARLKD